MPRASSLALPAHRVAILQTPPVACIVPEGVFDAFGWCDSDTLEWRRPADTWDGDPCMTADNPPGMVFVLRRRCDWLPTELARLHAFGLGLSDEAALAPYAIDDATDELHARKVRPRDLLWLAAPSLRALAWGLHDWAHFHNHGPFERRAWTELQCDATALAWLWTNRHVVGLDVRDWETARRSFVALSASRFATEGLPFEPSLLEAVHLRGLAPEASP